MIHIYKQDNDTVGFLLYDDRYFVFRIDKDVSFIEQEYHNHSEYFLFLGYTELFDIPSEEFVWDRLYEII